MAVRSSMAVRGRFERFNGGSGAVRGWFRRFNGVSVKKNYFFFKKKSNLNNPNRSGIAKNRNGHLNHLEHNSSSILINLNRRTDNSDLKSKLI